MTSLVLDFKLFILCLGYVITKQSEDKNVVYRRVRSTSSWDSPFSPTTYLSNSFPSDLCVYVLSCVQLFATSWTVAPLTPLSMGFSRQEYWNGLPCPPPGDLPNPGIEPRVRGRSMHSSMGLYIVTIKGLLAWWGNIERERECGRTDQRGRDIKLQTDLFF